MLFNSYEFIFLFLPLATLVFFAINRAGRETAIAWLVLASLFFYGWWNPAYLVLILLSMGINFIIGVRLGKLHEKQREGTAKLLLILGITLNLAALGYYKYAGFFVETLNSLAGTSFELPSILLHIPADCLSGGRLPWHYPGISFFPLCAFRHLLSPAYRRAHCPS